MLNLQLSRKSRSRQEKGKIPGNSSKNSLSQSIRRQDKNDYILTNPERTQNMLDSLPDSDYEIKKQANL